MKKFLGNLTERQKKIYAWCAVSGILVIMFLIAIFSSAGAFGIPGDSGTTDEVAHIPSGYSYVKYNDFRLNPEHPPLAKAIAGAPLALQSDIVGPKDNWSWNGLNQWESGWYMLYESSNKPAKVLFWSRLPMILLMIGLGLFLYKWSKEIFGRKVALLVLILYSFYPDVLAHGRLVTTDVPAAFGFVVATYYFNKALENRTIKSLLFAALALALAQLLKFSAFLLFVVFLILIVVRAILERSEKERFWPLLWRYFKLYFWTSVLSVIVVWIVYLPFVWNTPPDIEHKVIESNLTSDARTLPLRNLLHHMEGNVITRALGHYLLGIMLVVGRVGGGNATFALGHLSDKSIPWYFPFAWLVKTPITIIILFFSSLVAYFTKRKKSKETIWLGVLLLTPIIVYWGFTLKGSLNIGIRHLMPTVPFVLLFIGWLLYTIWQQHRLWLKLVVGALIAFMVGSTISYYPSFIGYFNEFVPRGDRYKYLIDSSLDWGQDMLRLKKYVDDNEIKDIKVDYFGGSMRSYYLPQSKPWHSSYGPTTGWLAISATFYQSSKLYGPMEKKWSYSWLDDYKPTAEIGGSILVFHITADDLRAHPPTSPYPIVKIDPVGSLDK